MPQLKVLVKANSKKGPLIEETEAGLVVYVREPAVEGKANKAVAAVLARHFSVPPSRMVLKSGHNSRHKTFEY